MASIKRIFLGSRMSSFILFAFAMTGVLTACQTAEPTLERRPLPTPTEVLEDHEVVERYLNCEDCLDGELEAVLELGDRASPILLEFLASGPSPETLRSTEKGLNETYAQMAEYAKIQEDRTLQPRQSQDEFVRTFLDNLNAQYQTRSVRAIVLIGDEVAIEKTRGILEKQLARTEREDLRAMLLLAFGELK
jgi:hypothetical protein